MPGLRLIVAVFVVACLSLAAAAAQLQTPSDWRWRTDAPATLVQQQSVPADAWRFVAMPPGWHVTTGPGALLYHPDYQGKGQFAVEAELVLFPGEALHEYGVFLGGRNLAPNESPRYIAFVARRDGRGAVIRGGGGAPLVDWQASEGITAHAGKGTVTNRLRVEVNAEDVVFSANGKPVATLPRAGLDLDGPLGFRIGEGMNLHLTRLDVTYRLAPVPVK